jgi:hypothetical protein
MKTLLLSVVTVVGLSAFSAKAQDMDYSAPVNFKLTGLVQGEDIISVKGDTTTTKSVVTKVKITNKEILALLADEAGETFPSGAKLVGNLAESEGGFDVVVADKAGTSILYSPDLSLTGDDLEVGTGKDSETESDTSSKSAYAWTGTTIGSVDFSSSEDSFLLEGLTTIKSSGSTSDSDTKSTETDKGSVKASVAGTGYSASAGGEAIIFGTVTAKWSYKTSEVY